MRSSRVWMRSSRVVRAFDCRNSPWFDPSIFRHSGIWGAADEAVLNTVHRKNPKNPPVRVSDAESRHGCTRVPGHAPLAWRSSWRMVEFIYYITAAGNSISAQLGSSCQGNRYGTEKAGGVARPSRTKSHLVGHSPLASQGGRRVGPSL